MARVSSDQALWMVPGQLEFVLAHVDDLIFIGSPSHVTSRKSLLAAKFEFKDLVPASTFVGVRFTRDRQRRQILLDQLPYVLEILDEFQLTNSVPVAISMDPKEPWLGGTPMVTSEIPIYRRAIGKLMYLMIATRPDISFAVTKLAQFSAAPTITHWNGVIRNIRYLRHHGCVQLCLGFHTTPNTRTFTPPSNILGFFDASLMDCAVTRRSTGGYTFFYHGSLISWQSKRQGLIALSTTEAEFISGTDAARELLWICGFLECIGMNEFTPRLLGDNKGALALARHNDYRPRTKHIHACERFIANLVANQQCFLD